MKIVILLGAPGSGKGTVAGYVKEQRGFEQLSTGDMLRAAVRGGTDVGQLAKGFMDRGELVPDEVIIRIVREYLESHGKAAKYLLDGFPRTVAQAEALDLVLAEMHEKIFSVVQMDVPEWLIIKRITGRRVCKQCGDVYNLPEWAPKVEGVCDKCGGPVIQRNDDKPETVANRLAVYEKQTAPLIEFYKKTHRTGMKPICRW
jgi:adenylate kinase